MPVIQLDGVSISSAVVMYDYADVTVTAGSTAAGYAPENVRDPATWNSWRSGSSDRYITFDYGAAVDIDSVGVAAHNIFSSGTTFRIEYSSDGSSFTTLVTQTLTSNDDILFLFQKQTYRYWRFTLPVAAANIGVIQAGKRIVFPYAPLDDYVPIYYGRTYTKLRNESLRGQLLGNRVIAAGATTEVDLGPLSRKWVDDNVKSFKNHYDQGGTFFYASCPSKYPQDMGYCWAPEEESSMAITYTDGINNATVNFGLRSYVAQ